jgi:short-subunit dehydrogenase
MTDYKTVLVTGASGGIGAAFTRELAQRGSDLVIVARSADKLNALAADLRAQHGRRVEVIADDLSQPDAGVRIKQKIDALGLSIDLLINNAGFGTMGKFVTIDAAREQEEIRLNISALVDLTHAFLPAMLAARHGGVVNVASAAAFQPLPHFAVYAATKAFVLSFTEALRIECRGTGVQIMSVCPGPVETGFFDAIGNDKARKSVPKGTMVTPELIVESSLRGLQSRSALVTPGAVNTISSAMARMLPGRWVGSLVAAATK